MARRCWVVFALLCLASISPKAGAFPSDQVTDEKSKPDDVNLSTQLTVRELTVASKDSCLRAGGICVAKNQCPLDKLASSQDELCQDGAECCHSLPNDITNCSERGGECRPSSECGRAPRDPLGNCSIQDQICCVLIT